MIKQIQLRGISRTPSDRMVEDGGVSESLNMYLDSAESAPVLLPKDVTSELGLPQNLEADRVFIHETPEYKSYIVSASGNIFSYKNSEKRHIYTLAEDEQLQHIASIGNALIITTNRAILYFLCKDSEYIALGSNLPDVSCGFVNLDQQFDPNNGGQPATERMPKRLVNTPYTSPSKGFWWGTADKDYAISDADTLVAMNQIWDGFQDLLTYNKKRGCLWGPILLRYAITLYDDTHWFVSAPIMLGAGFNTEKGTLVGDEIPLEITFSSGQTAMQITLKGVCYKIGLHRSVSNTEKLLLWKDIIKSIDIYSSPMINLFPNGNKAGYMDNTTKLLYFDPVGSSAKGIEESISSYGEFFKIKSYSLEDFLKYEEGKYEEITCDMSDSALVGGAKSLDETESFEELLALRSQVYNKHLLLTGVEKLLSRGLSVLNGQHARYGSYEYKYKFRFYIRGVNQPHVVYSNVLHPQYGAVRDNSNTSNYEIVNTEPFSFISYPNSNCFKVEIDYLDNFSEELQETKAFEMKRHPYIPNCSYCWIGLGKSFAREPGAIPNEYPISKENRLIQETNKLFLSESENPFVFPLKYRYTFQSKVIGVAIATSALSQGQFGQFPLYVFTEDGIWAMETGADGSFVSSKPLSREVCSNPDSITSIDNAVVFVTKKGVMLLQGSEVVELSPNMNGRHYTPNESATALIGKQGGYSNLVDAIEDKDSFVAFMQDAKIAYDYEGKRLIFISPSNKGFQYLYKIDTQTWHKVSLGKNFIAPLNSYPECLVQTKSDELKEFVEVNSPYEGSQRNGALAILKREYPNLPEESLNAFLDGKYALDITDHQSAFFDELLDYYDIATRVEEVYPVKIYDCSTVLTPDSTQETAKGIIITRPFDLGEPDVYKTIKAIKIRGDYDKGNVQYFLQGSDDGRTFYNLTSLRGKSWKMFRLFILADLEPTERISWVDVEYDTRFKNRLR